MKIHRNKNKGGASAAGFTLVESAVALTIGAIMLTSLYAAFASGFANIRMNRENIRAEQIMLSRLESARLAGFTQVTDRNYFPPAFNDEFDPQQNANNNGGTIYHGRFSTTVPPAGTLPEAYRTNMLLITVGLNWTSGGLQHTNWMQTYVAQSGMQSYVSVGR
jgi:prepilin-type N-terminal cleavage/methylation domain-containing protein